MDMNTEISKQGEELTVKIAGRLDSFTAPELAKEIKSEIEGMENIIFDFKGLDYISSAGIRVIASAAKQLGMDNVSIINANDEAREVFSLVGMDSFIGD